MKSFLFINVGTRGQSVLAPHFSSIIRQSAPLQLKKLPGFYMRMPLNTCAFHFLNASYICVFITSYTIAKMEEDNSVYDKIEEINKSK